LGIIFQHLLMPSIVFFFIFMMIMTAGVNATQMTLFFYLPDISLWLVIASILSIIEAFLKIPLDESSTRSRRSKHIIHKPLTNIRLVINDKVYIKYNKYITTQRSRE